MRFIWIALILLVSPAFAQDWQELDGAGILAALNDQTYDYPRGVWQQFSQSGETLYNAGRDSWGNWRVEGDQYCSQWPPGQDWDCFVVDSTPDGRQIRFRGEFGDITVGLLRGGS